LVPAYAMQKAKFTLPDLLVAAIGLAAAAGGLRIAFALPMSVLLVSLGGFLVFALVLIWHQGAQALTPADRVTLGRGVLVILLVGLMPAADWFVLEPGLLFALALAAVLLDGVDGAVARRFRCATAKGARFDMELDAVLLLVLCIWLFLIERAGPWVLAIGAWRYGFILAGQWRASLRSDLSPSQRRRIICAIQGIGLVLCLAPSFPVAWVPALALTLLLLLSVSFILDMRALW